jgi:hypothetical protein
VRRKFRAPIQVRTNAANRRMNMKTKTTNSGIKVTTNVKAGTLYRNHTRNGLKVRAGVKAAGLFTNHSRIGLKVKAGIKAGGKLHQNHNARVMAIR